MKFWQIAVIAIAILLLSVVVLRWMPSVLSASGDSGWLGVILYGFIVVPGLITVGIICGVWRLGSHGNFNFWYGASEAFLRKERHSQHKLPMLL